MQFMAVLEDGQITRAETVPFCPHYRSRTGLFSSLGPSPPSVHSDDNYLGLRGTRSP